MKIFPAIDIKGGKCVRLYQGREDMETVYFEDPVMVAKMWQQQGAKYIHVVDLDGAFQGKRRNMDTIRNIISSVDIPVQIGGGIRTIEDARELINAGAARFIISTVAVNDREMLLRMLSEFGDRVVVSLDCISGYVSTHGWVDKSTLELVSFAKELESLGVRTIVHTDVSRDGTLEGPNFDELVRVISSTNLQVIVSGGIGKLEDVEKARSIGAYGTIVGKALYEGVIGLEDIC